MDFLFIFYCYFKWGWVIYSLYTELHSFIFQNKICLQNKFNIFSKIGESCVIFFFRYVILSYFFNLCFKQFIFISGVTYVFLEKGSISDGNEYINT